MPESRYRGPVTRSTHEFGAITVQLARPAEPERLLDDPAVLALNRADGDYMPYWAYLWPGAFLLSEVLASAPELPAGEALELGCGLGLAGLVAAQRGLRVHCTDYDPGPFSFIHESAAACGLEMGRVTTGLLDYGRPGDCSAAFVIGADLLYEHRLVTLVCEALASLLTPEGEAWIADPHRVATEGLPAALQSHGLRATTAPITARDESGRRLRGTLHRIWRSGPHMTVK